MRELRARLDRGPHRSKCLQLRQSHPAGSPVPSLAVISQVHSQFRDCAVRVEPVAGKGLGLIANRRIDAGDSVASYIVRPLRRVPFDATYAIKSSEPGSSHILCASLVLAEH